MIVTAAANPTLQKMLRSLDSRVRRARFIANLSERRWAEAVAEHREILEALAARNAADLRECLRRHLANKFRALRRRLTEIA
ncbi:MAG: FCD domain-containing protein [Alphaproteobacteria bacterium]|nr:MAG: FCD domain-containing protein [Alphaproteobacteria bacterium]